MENHTNSADGLPSLQPLGTSSDTPPPPPRFTVPPLDAHSTPPVPPAAPYAMQTPEPRYTAPPVVTTEEKKPAFRIGVVGGTLAGILLLLRIALLVANLPMYTAIARAEEMEKSDPNGAVEEFLKLSSAYPTRAEVQVGLAESSVRAGRWETASAALDNLQRYTLHGDLEARAKAASAAYNASLRQQLAQRAADNQRFSQQQPMMPPMPTRPMQRPPYIPPTGSPRVIIVRSPHSLPDSGAFPPPPGGGNVPADGPGMPPPPPPADPGYQRPPGLPPVVPEIPPAGPPPGQGMPPGPPPGGPPPGMGGGGYGGPPPNSDPQAPPFAPPSGP